MKKKILFVTPHMICGGVEKSLISLINEIPQGKYEVKILMVKAIGELLEYIPTNVIVDELPLSKKASDELLAGGAKKNIINCLKKFKVLKATKILMKKVVLKHPFPELSDRFSSINEINEKFDVAIAYHMHMPFIVEYVAYKVKSNKKAVWIHNDFNSSGYNPMLIEKSLDRYDKIYAVSKQVKDEFIKILPQYEYKTEIFYNIISKKVINSMVKTGEYYDGDFEGIRLLSIGRLDKQKGFDLAIKVCKKLIDENINIKWYIIGDGNEREKLEALIKENNLSNNFYLLGVKTNPYKYLNGCDIYIQPSRHEGYGIALAEARHFNKPIIATDFAGAREQLINNKNGIICKFDEEDLYTSIKELVEDSNKREMFTKELSIEINENCNEVNKLLILLDDI